MFAQASTILAPLGARQHARKCDHHCLQFQHVCFDIFLVLKTQILHKALDYLCMEEYRTMDQLVHVCNVTQ
jgi:hypothetical protein